MYQLVFNILLKSRAGGLLFKLFFTLRGLLIKCFPYALINYSYKGVVLKLPLSHDYPFNLKIHPGYSENLGLIASVIKEKYPRVSCIDVGANVGDSVAIVNSFAPMPILCIEGNEMYLPILRHNALKYPNVEIEDCFVGESSETVIAINHGGSAHLKVSESGTRVKVLHDILSNHVKFAESKLFKIDTDGFDLKILRGANQFLKDVKPVIFFEYDPYYLLLQNEYPLSVFEQLNKLGYEKCLLFDNLGDFLCEVDSNDKIILNDLTCFFNHQGKRYIDVCALHISDNDLISLIRSKFQ